MLKSCYKNNFIQQFFLFRVSVRHAFMRVPRRMCVMMLTQELAFWHRIQMPFALFISRGMYTLTDTEEKKLLNKVIISIFFADKKYSRSFITLQLKHWCHMDYFNNVFTSFLDLEHVSCIAVYARSESSWSS